MFNNNIDDRNLVFSNMGVSNKNCNYLNQPNFIIPSFSQNQPNFKTQLF